MKGYNYDYFVFSDQGSYQGVQPVEYAEDLFMEGEIEQCPVNKRIMNAQMNNSLKM